MSNNWSDRDVAVVPWIKLNNKDGASNIMHPQTSHESPKLYQHPASIKSSSNKILTLLGARERIGSKQTCGRIGWLNEGVVVSDVGLAKVGAWNSRRLQNMTLSIGPGTPASCVLTTSEGDDSVSSSAVDDDDDDEMLDSADEQIMARMDRDDERMAAVAAANANANEEEDSSDSSSEGEQQELQQEHEDMQEGKQDDDDSPSSDSDDDEMEVLPSDAEEGQTYHFDDRGRLVKNGDGNTNNPRSHVEDEDDVQSDSSAAARAEANAEIARQLSARITQSQDEVEGEGDEDEPPRGSRRSRWEKRQQSILDALNGVGNEDDDDEEMHEDDASRSSHHTNIASDAELQENESNDSDNDNNNENDDNSHDNASSNSSNEGSLSARDRYNIHQVERYIDHLENLARRREERAAAASLLSSPARGAGVYNSNTQMYEREVSRSMKHGGCINTVSWLDAGWRVSTAAGWCEDWNLYDHYREEYVDEDEGVQGFMPSSTSYSCNESIPFVTPPRGQRSRRGRGWGLAAPLAPNEFPTQLLTSGDDHLVKFWDVSQSMGSTSPLPGGSATHTPFSSPRMPMRACSELVDTWKVSSSTIGSSNHRRYLPGVVHPLITMSTGHRGNVFHVTTVPHTIGKVATCAADGYLRLLDVEVHSTSSPPASGRNRSNSTTSSSSNNGGAEASAIVISPEYTSENGEEPVFRFHNSVMCFSHHFLSANVGLVCSERGLLHFDLRLPARSQKRGSLVPELSRTCKACYPWRLGSLDGDDSEMESSAYVFAGGTGVDVGLYDLRMTGSSSMLDNDNQVVQKYRPRALKNKSSVAVSGIDLSKDKRELLVSYESDHVYTFPIFDGKDPTLNDIDCNTKADKPVPELAAYGGHLNRLTFLKSAKYAGPNDEYICTGSDSGHAWIYEKESGTVVSFIKADNSTCNGIQPHPSLPYFITYGIDSTAKLWRATTPVDIEVDDSDLGRYNYSKRVKYEKSIIADEWKKARKGKEVDLDDEDLSFFPDETSDDDNDDPDHFLGVFIRSRFSPDTPFIGNDLMNLNKTLAKNYFTCARSLGMGDDEEPVKSGIKAMKRRVSLSKLRHQADRLGLDFNSDTPWILKPKEHLKTLSEEGEGSGGELVSYGCLADLIPDNPSDWLPFEKLLANPPRSGGMRFNTKYLKYHLESSANHSISPVGRGKPIELNDDTSEIDQLDVQATKQPHTMQSNELLQKSAEKQKYDPNQAWDILLQTVSLLKEAGNEALKASLPFLAARRYDKAINYCACAYLEFPVGTVDFLIEHQYVVSKNSGYECRWNELLKTLIMVRLNLAMVYLKPEINDTKGAISQANLSLKELKPFAAEKGIVLTGKKLAKKRTEEPHSTFNEAKALQAKAYFRLGSAQLVMHEYDEAVKAFELCADSTKEAGMTVDAGILRKMNEAKRCRKEKKERQRKKFKFMFASKNNDEAKDQDEVVG